jgi:hypothetical protein
MQGGAGKLSSGGGASRMGRGLAPLLNGTIERGDWRDSEFAPLALLLIPLSLFAAVFVWYLGNDLRLQIESATWPSVQGRIVRSELVSAMTTGSGMGSQTQRAVVGYEYEVGGQLLRSFRIAYSLGEHDFEDSRKIIERFPVGRVVAVHYRPGDVRASVLLRGMQQGCYGTIALLVWIGSAPVLGLILFGLWYLRATRSNWISGFLVEDDGGRTVARVPASMSTLSGGVFFIVVGLAAGVALVSLRMPSALGLLCQGVLAVLCGAIGIVLAHLAQRKPRDLVIDWPEGVVFPPRLWGREFVPRVALDDIRSAGVRDVVQEDANGRRVEQEVVVEMADGRLIPIAAPRSRDHAGSLAKWLVAVLAVPEFHGPRLPERGGG